MRRVRQGERFTKLHNATLSTGQQPKWIGLTSGRDCCASRSAALRSWYFSRSSRSSHVCSDQGFQYLCLRSRLRFTGGVCGVMGPRMCVGSMPTGCAGGPAACAGCGGGFGRKRGTGGTGAFAACPFFLGASLPSFCRNFPPMPREPRFREAERTRFSRLPLAVEDDAPDSDGGGPAGDGGAPRGDAGGIATFLFFNSREDIPSTSSQ